MARALAKPQGFIGRHALRISVDMAEREGRLTACAASNQAWNFLRATEYGKSFLLTRSAFIYK